VNLLFSTWLLSFLVVPIRGVLIQKSADILIPDGYNQADMANLANLIYYRSLPIC